MPTSELPSHLLTYAFLIKNNFNQRAIIHTHPDHLIALSHLKKYAGEKPINHLLRSIHPEMKIVIPEGIGYVKYRKPGTEGLARATVEQFKNHRLIIWERHGCIAVGKDLFEAFDLIETADKIARIFFLCKKTGY